jgi:putative hemolysin
MERKATLTYASQVEGKAKKVLVHLIEHLTGRRRLEKIYSHVLNTVDDNHALWGAALGAMRVELQYDRALLEMIPREGPLIFIANHPYGVIDGLAICHLAALTRRDFRILINKALCLEERLAEYMLPIDFNESEEAVQTNIDSKRKSVEALRKGGAVVIFPAGGIATAVSPFGKVTDLDWKLFAAKLVQTTKATVVPVYFHGQNSRLFQLVSQFSLTLRLSLIIYEVNKQIAKPLHIAIGAPLTHEQLAGIKGRQALMDHLRQVTYGLAASPDVQVFLPPNRKAHLQNKFVRQPQDSSSRY